MTISVSHYQLGKGKILKKKHKNVKILLSERDDLVADKYHPVYSVKERFKEDKK